MIHTAFLRPRLNKFVLLRCAQNGSFRVRTRTKPRRGQRVKCCVSLLFRVGVSKCQLLMIDVGPYPPKNNDTPCFPGPLPFLGSGLEMSFHTEFRGFTVRKCVLLVSGKFWTYNRSARGFSDRDFGPCPYFYGRPYLLGFEKFLTEATGEGEGRTGMWMCLRLRSHVSRDHRASAAPPQ